MAHSASLVLAKKILNAPVGDILAPVEALRAAGQQNLHAVQDEAAGTKASQTDDPIEVLCIAHEADTELGQKIEQALTPAEDRAVAEAAQPTPGPVEALQAAARPVEA
ncbi:hypothetical protein [Streptomyces sp. NPDC056399]|uniref:hypothetical protein n=1 Tax=Streptomyces sp. NPDC056399 TaxID=3345807 RepID=UPI0035E2DACD